MHSYFYNGSPQAWCHNLPFGGGAKGSLSWAKGASSIEGKRAESPPTFIRGKHQKNQKDDGLHILKMRVQNYVFSLFYVFMYFSILCAFYVFLLLCAFITDFFLNFILFF